ncbi:hypothetical protein CRUP_003387 [Coryphaenoides rupestris]|nr:hypothetical protein CRUP_003387 [Coryphaenoides rupestris]
MPDWENIFPQYTHGWHIFFWFRPALNRGYGVKLLQQDFAIFFQSIHRFLMPGPNFGHILHGHHLHLLGHCCSHRMAPDTRWTGEQSRRREERGSGLVPGHKHR